MKPRLSCISPVDGSVYVERDYADDKQIAATLEAAREAQLSWAKKTVTERAHYCYAAVDALIARKAEIASEISWQMGRPISYCGGEIDGFAERARYMIDIADDKLRDVVPESVAGFKRFIKREPHGVVFTITPWNYPYLTAVNSIIPAIMAGNAVIMKGSVQTPLCSERIAQAFDQAGLPKGVFQYLHLQHESTDRLVKWGAIDYISFTGSTAGGIAMEKMAAGHFIEMAMELGGKDPAYVRSDSGLSYAVENLVDGAFFNSGQSCCGVERIYVHKDIYEPFVHAFVKQVEHYKLGNPLDDQATLGPMVSTSAAEKVRKQISEAVEEGARPWIDARDFPMDRVDSPYLAPQVLTDVNHSMGIMRLWSGSGNYVGGLGRTGHRPDER
jgi:acyl-CoA reductase-like NAD-dependent aldehyde dehydrogenase